uniref:Uncharacterized protein n=1 Tax=Anguilla anguilla TaxID=7936 RepID=A0A0E9W071_ANGAN
MLYVVNILYSKSVPL